MNKYIKVHTWFNLDVILYAILSCGLEAHHTHCVQLIKQEPYVMHYKSCFAKCQSNNTVGPFPLNSEF